LGGDVTAGKEGFGRVGGAIPDKELPWPKAGRGTANAKPLSYRRRVDRTAAEGREEPYSLLSRGSFRVARRRLEKGKVTS